MDRQEISKQLIDHNNARLAAVQFYESTIRKNIERLGDTDFTLLMSDNNKYDTHVERIRNIITHDRQNILPVVSITDWFNGRIEGIRVSRIDNGGLQGFQIIGGILMKDINIKQIIIEDTKAVLARFLNNINKPK